MIYSPLLTFKSTQRNRKLFLLTLPLRHLKGITAQLMSKSGLKVLYELEVKAGVIDPDFTGNIGVVLKNNSDQPIEHLAGKQIAQAPLY